MVTKRDLEVAIAAYGLGRVLPPGSTRAAARATVGAIVKGGRLIVPPVARAAPVVGRGALAAARANPVGASIGAALLAREAGLLDPVDEYIQRAIDARVQPIRDAPETLQRAIESPVFKPAIKRQVSKYSKAVKAGMAAVKRSKFSGKPGRISTPKAAFKTVNLVASAVNKGKKVATTGIRGVVARAVRKIL